MVGNSIRDILLRVWATRTEETEIEFVVTAEAEGIG